MPDNEELLQQDGETIGHEVSEGAASLPRVSLRELATRPPEEIRRVVRAAGIAMDPDEIEAWDGTELLAR